MPHKVVVGGHGGFACIAHRQGRSSAVLFDAAGVRALPNLSGRRTLLPHVGLTDGGWLAEAYDADGPAEVMQVAPNGLCRRLTGASSSLRRHCAVQDFGGISPDGRRLQGWLHEPETRSLGLIVHVHDGPSRHSEDRANPDVGFWVQLCYTVLDANCRGSTGFGRDWREGATAEGCADREQDDLRTGVAAVVKLGFAPPSVAVTGTGLGGSASWRVLLRWPGLVTAAIPICGSYGLDIGQGHSVLSHDTPLDAKTKGTGTLAPQPAITANASPMPNSCVQHIRGHLLMIHGQADAIVDPEQTLIAARELTAAGIPPEVLIFPNEGHGVTRRTNVATRLTRSAVFLAHAFAKGLR